jgi:hypothetical protein
MSIETRISRLVKKTGVKKSLRTVPLKTDSSLYTDALWKRGRWIYFWKGLMLIPNNYHFTRGMSQTLIPYRYRRCRRLHLHFQIIKQSAQDNKYHGHLVKGCIVKGFKFKRNILSWNNCP